ncbi:TRAFAC clade GTPase domain-containing protein [Hymenobacter edaphi]|nr:hypothetical protein [Hymenobacter edaphi]
MQNGRCTNIKCGANATGLCLLNNPKLTDCEHWQPDATNAADASNKKAKSTSGQTRAKRGQALEGQSVEWTGYPLRLAEIELVSRRTNPLIIAPVGAVSAGKSSFLGMLHSLLLRGHGLAQYTFAGSLTLLGWEDLAVALRFHRGQATDQIATPSDPTYYSLLHWAMRRADGYLRDVLFPDASGEVFSQWAVNQSDPNADNVRWIHRHADAFVFFIDCEALVLRRGAAVSNLMDLAGRLAHGLNGRPVVVAWAKADMMDQVRPTVKQSLLSQLEQVLGAVPHFEISKQLQGQPDPRQLANLGLVDHILQVIESNRPDSPEVAIPVGTQDHFFLYRGK